METFVYDDDCGFCTWCASIVAERTDAGIVGFSELTDEERARLPEEWRECAHLLTDEEVYSCGEAIEEALVRADLVPHEVFDMLAFVVPNYEEKRERLYHWGAHRRGIWGKFVYKQPPTRREPGTDEEEERK